MFSLLLTKYCLVKLLSAVWSRGQDLNLHVTGYEPAELPVLYPAKICAYV